MGNAIGTRALKFVLKGEDGRTVPNESEKGNMKKLLTSGVLALTLAALSTQSAMAWVNSKFGVGLNWNYQSGGNSLLFGLFRNGQPPAPDCGIGGPGYVPGPIPGPAPCPNGGPYHGLFQPGAEQGVAAPDAAAAASNVQGRTQSYNRYYSNQTVNYQYPYYYNQYYYGYGR